MAQFKLQGLQGLVHVTFHGFFGNTELRSNLLSAQVCCTAELEDLPCLRRKSGTFPINTCRQFFGADQVVGSIVRDIDKIIKAVEITLLYLIARDKVQKPVLRRRIQVPRKGSLILYLGPLLPNGQKDIVQNIPHNLPIVRSFP